MIYLEIIQLAALIVIFLCLIVIIGWIRIIHDKIPTSWRIPKNTGTEKNPKKNPQGKPNPFDKFGDKPIFGKKGPHGKKGIATPLDDSKQK